MLGNQVGRGRELVFGGFTLFRRPYLTGRATIGRLELPPGEGRFLGVKERNLRL